MDFDNINNLINNKKLGGGKGMENENMDLRIRNIMERVRKVYAEDAIKFEIAFWDFKNEKIIEKKYVIWIAVLSTHYDFQSIEEIEEWLAKKELLFKKL